MKMRMEILDAKSQILLKAGRKSSPEGPYRGLTQKVKAESRRR